MAERKHIPLRVTLALAAGLSLPAAVACRSASSNSAVSESPTAAASLSLQDQARALVEQKGLAIAGYVKDRLKSKNNGYMEVGQAQDQSPTAMQAELACETFRGPAKAYDLRVVFRVPLGNYADQKTDQAAIRTLKPGDVRAIILEEDVPDKQDPNATDQKVVYSIDAPGSPFFDASHSKQWEAEEQFASGRDNDTEDQHKYTKRPQDPKATTLTTAEVILTNLDKALGFATNYSDCFPVPPELLNPVH